MNRHHLNRTERRRALRDLDNARHGVLFIVDFDPEHGAASAAYGEDERPIIDVHGWLENGLEAFVELTSSQARQLASELHRAAEKADQLEIPMPGSGT